MNELAVNMLHSLALEVIDEISERSPRMRNLIDQNWAYLPRHNVSLVFIEKISGKFQVSIWKTDGSQREQKYVPVDADLASVCNRLKPEYICFKGDSMIPLLNFDWVNGAERVSFKSGENRENIEMFFEKYTKSEMDFHATIPVTADEVVRSMTSLTKFRYTCGSRGITECIFSKDTLRLMAEKSNFGPGIASIFIFNKFNDGIFEPQDITEFLKNAKFEFHETMTWSTGTWSRPFVQINYISATRQEFEEHMTAESFKFKILSKTYYEVFSNDKAVNLVLNFNSA